MTAKGSRPVPRIVVVNWCDLEGRALPCELTLTTAFRTYPPFVLSELPAHGGAWAVTTEIREEPLGLARSLAYDRMVRSPRWRSSFVVFRILQLSRRSRGLYGPRGFAVYRISSERVEDGRGR